MTMEHKNTCLPLIEDLSNALGQCIPGILASKPYLYMDSDQRSQAHLDDFEATVSLAVETVCALTPEDLHAF